MNKVTTLPPYSPAGLGTFGLRGNNNNNNNNNHNHNHNHNRVRIHPRLDRADPERAGERFPGSVLLPPSLTLTNRSDSGSCGSGSGSGSGGFRNRSNKSSHSNRCIADALAILRSSKRRKHSYRNVHANNAGHRREGGEDGHGHGSSKTQNHQPQTPVNDGSDQSVESMENHHYNHRNHHPISPNNDDAQEMMEKNSGQKPCSAAAAAAVVVVDGVSNTVDKNIAVVHTDPKSVWTIGVLPPLTTERNLLRERRDPIPNSLRVLTTTPSLSSEVVVVVEEAREENAGPRPYSTTTHAATAMGMAMANNKNHRNRPR